MADAPKPTGTALERLYGTPENLPAFTGTPAMTGQTAVGTAAPTPPTTLERLFASPEQGPLLGSADIAGEVLPELTPFDKPMASATAALKSVPSGALVGSSTVGGMILGAPLGVPGVVIGGLGGLGIGVLGSIPLDNFLNSNTPPRYFNDPRLVPYYQGGKTFGMTIGSAPMAFNIPAVSGGRVATLLTSMRQEARARPIGMLTGEVVSGLGAGTAGGTVLSFDPYAEKTRMGAEVVGGMFTPVLRIATSAVRNSGSIFDSIKQRYSPEAREYKAAEYLKGIFEQTGEDPQKLLARLAVDLPEGVPEPSGAQRTGSLALTVLENTLARGNAAYGTQINAQGAAAFRGFERVLTALYDTGDPQALQLAARSERQFFKSLLKNRLSTAEENAAEAIRRIQVDTAETRAQVGNVLRDEVEQSLADARTYGTGLWRQAELEAVDVTPGSRGLENATVTPRMLQANETSRGMLNAMTSVTPEYLRSMPGYETAAAIANRFGVRGDALDTYRQQGRLSMDYLTTGKAPQEAITNVQEIPISYMIQARGDLLGLQRQAASGGDMNAARIYGEMSDAILSDLDELQTPAYNRARAYERELNDFYSRTFAGDLLRVNPQGADRLPAEILVAKAFGSNNDVTSLRMEQVMGAANSLNYRYEKLLQELGPDHPQVLELAPFAINSAGRAASVRDAQRRWLLLGANKVLKQDPSSPTGGVTVDQPALNRFIFENRRELTDAGLINDLENTQTANTLLRQVREGNSAFNQNVDTQMAFGLVLGSENPVRVVNDALKSRFPIRNMNRLITLARQAKAPDGTPVEGAVDGLKSVLFDYAYTAAGGQNGGFSPTAFYDTLFKPVARGQVSLAQLMINRGVMTGTERRNLKTVLSQMMRIEDVASNKQQLDELFREGSSPVQEIMLRVIGSKLGRLGGGSGESLVLAGAGSRMLRDAVQNQPSLMIADILQRASQDGKLLTSLIQKVKPGDSASVTTELLRRLRTQGMINGLNITTASTATMNQYEPVEQPVSGAYSPRPQPPAPATRGVGTPAPAGGAPAGGAPAPAPTPGPVGAAAPQQQGSRAMLAQLFPFDATLQAGG